VWKEVNSKWSKLYDYTGHDSSVNSICWSPAEFGLNLASASSDGTVSIISSTGEGVWEVKKVPSTAQPAHSVGCNAVSWCPSTTPGSLIEPQHQTSNPSLVRKRIATGGCDNLVKIWKEDDSGQWVEEHSLEAHKDWVRDVAWAPSVGLPVSIIASCSQDHRVITWKCSDLEGGQWQSQVLHTFDDVIWHVSWSLCGTILAVSGGDNKISLWKETLDEKRICISDSHKSHAADPASRG